MFVPDHKIGALSYFLQQLDKSHGGGKKLRFYRGHSKTSFGLLPSVYRNSGWIGNESIMLKELILRCPNDFPGALTTFQSLVKMQHYGLPTRLLDITSNPLVALFFACESHGENEEDGEVIAFDYDVDEVKYFDSDTVSVVANLARRPRDFEIPTIDNLATFNEAEPIKLLLHDIGSDKPHFSPKIRAHDLQRVLCVKPKLENARIIRQEGAFLLFGCSGIKSKPAELDDGVISARFVINQDEKRNIKDQLEKIGISRATFFPEIEQVSIHIKNAYFVPHVAISKMTPLQAKVLRMLLTSGTVSVRDVAKSVQTAPSSVSRAISQLRNLDIVVPCGSGRDRKWKVADGVVVTDEQDSAQYSERKLPDA